MFFVYLQVGMIRLTTKIGAFVFLLWYCFSIIGFDIHTCRAEDQCFVTTFINGMECADVHPDHDCCHEHHGDCCCHHESKPVSSLDFHGCCSDDYMALSLTGVSVDEKHGSDHPCICGFCPLQPVIRIPDVHDGAALSHSVLFPDVGSGTSRDILSAYSVLRI